MTAAKDKDKDQETIRFSYIKSNLFRVVHVEGGIGSVTPTGKIHLALYSERLAIPRELVHEVKEDGSLGEEQPDERVTRGGVIRELEVDLMMDLAAARSIRAWLDDKIGYLEGVFEELTNQAASGSES